MTHPTTEHLGDRHLLENCVKWQLNVTAALQIGPGARDQILHREEDLYPYWTPPRPNLILACMWAISESSPQRMAARRSCREVIYGG